MLDTNRLYNNNIFISIGTATLFLLIALFFFIPYITEKYTIQTIIKHSQNAAEQIKLTRAYYVDSVVKDVKKYAPELSFHYNHEGINGRLPLPTTTIHNLSEIFSKNTGLTYNLYSDYPFKHRQNRVLSSFQKEAIQYTEENKDGLYIKREILNGKEVLRVATTDYMTDISCVTCHNQHPDRTWKNTQWKIGDKRGVLEVITPLEDELKGHIIMRNYILLFVVVSVLLLMSYLLVQIKKREAELIHVADDLIDTVDHKTKEVHSLENLLDNYIIHSKTDTYGIIVFVSQAFINISGYTREELLNQPQSIIRHPDMDTSIFREMWKTLQDGRIWEGELKNRKKDGSFYWVYAVISGEYDINKRLTGYSAIRTDITAQKESQHLATHDTLTSLVNKHRFEAIAQHAIKVAKRNKTFIAVLFLDFDKFKNINDTLGHHIGDELLIEVSKRMKNALRETDTVARIGGDEFMILIDSIVDDTTIPHMIRKILDAIRMPMPLSSSTLHVTASMGVSLYPNDGLTIEDLMKNADAAMYYAKDRGRDNYQFFTQAIHYKLLRITDVEQALKQAIIDKTFTFVYQAKYDLNTRKCVGAEILIRLLNNTLGTISPTEFIPIAEENNMIHDITDLVIEQAILALSTWKKAGIHIDIISINISSLNLSHKNFIQNILKYLDASSLTPKNIELEITEHSIIDNMEENIQVLNKCRELGFSISIDDFGTGYSSISYLKELPIDTVKIDKSFVDGLTGEANKDNLVIVRTIIQLCRDLNYSVIAEGIEDSLQENILKELGSHYGQGNLFSKPISSDAFILLCKKSENN